MPTIAVDAMGGDLGPAEVARAVAQVSLGTQIECILVGDAPLLQAQLDAVPYNPELIHVRHTPEFVAMNEDPKTALRRKRNPSIAVATRLAASGAADAVVTTGNTGAAVLACHENFRHIRGIEKAALASVYPRQTEHPGQDRLALLLDVGATVHCSAAELVRFAIMGSAYARVVSKVSNPRVGLLNMGAEATKGGAVLAEAHALLSQSRAVHFVGNVEGHDLARGRADVIVCDGLLGNVVLKLFEGLSEVMVELTGGMRGERWREKLGLRMLESSLKRLRDLTDYTAYGGAPFLGFDRLLIKAHGRSTAGAVANAVKVAAKAVRDGVTNEIAAAVGQLR